MAANARVHATAQIMPESVPRLTEQQIERRRSSIKKIYLAQRILGASSLVERSRIFCGDYTKKFMAAWFPNRNGDPDDLQERYQELLSARSGTRETEEKRQHRLHEQSELIDKFRENEGQCEGMLSNDKMALPSDSQLNEVIATETAKMDEIDKSPM